MIDAQRAAVARVLADRLREQLVAVVAMRVAIGRRKAPVLAAGSKLIRRRSDAAPLA